MTEYHLTLTYSDDGEAEFTRFAFSAESAAKSCDLEFRKQHAIPPTGRLTSVVATWSL